MEIKIPFTNLKFTGKMRWNFPETDAEKLEIATNNAVLIISVLFVIILSPFVLVDVLIYAYLLAAITARKMNNFAMSYEKKDEIARIFYFGFLSAHGMQAMMALLIIVLLPFGFLDSFEEAIYAVGSVYYVYTWRDVAVKILKGIKNAMLD